MQQINRNEAVLIPATTQKNLENTLSGRSQSRNATSCLSPSLQSAQGQEVGVWVPEAGSLDSGDGCAYVNILKSTQLHALNGEVWYVIISQCSC